MSEEAGAGKFGVSRNMRVEELIAIYDGIIVDVDKALVDSSISVQIPQPRMPVGLDGYMQWGPHNDPLLPDDLTDLDSITIGKLYSFMSNWTNYVAGELTRAKCLHLVQERNQKVIYSALIAYYKDEMAVPAGRVEESIFTDKRYVDVDAGLLRSKVFVMSAESRHEQLKRSINLISREQTRRGEDFDRTNHESSSPEKSAQWRRIGRPGRPA